MSHKDKVYLYLDEGVSQESVEHTILTLKKIIKKYTVATICAEEVALADWTNDAALFVMPGGADLFYAKKLNGKGNKAIKTYVAHGGSFLGICAGSYYGASYVEFDKNGPLEVLGSRELGFFEGKAVGPILATYDYHTLSGSRAAKIHTTLPGFAEIVLFYNGGGFFENAGDDSNIKVIGTYENSLPAIILINYSRGKVLLSGVHFEYDPFYLRSLKPSEQKIIESLEESNELREVLFKELITLLEQK